MRACLFGRTGVRFRLECEPGGLVFARGGEQGSLIGFLSCDFECETDASVRFDGEGSRLSNPLGITPSETRTCNF